MFPPLRLSEGEDQKSDGRDHAHRFRPDSNEADFAHESAHRICTNERNNCPPSSPNAIDQHHGHGRNKPEPKKVLKRCVANHDVVSIELAAD
jgi:hypothetical protein